MEIKTELNLNDPLNDSLVEELTDAFFEFRPVKFVVTSMTPKFYLMDSDEEGKSKRTVEFIFQMSTK